MFDLQWALHNCPNFVKRCLSHFYFSLKGFSSAVLSSPRVYSVSLEEHWGRQGWQTLSCLFKPHRLSLLKTDKKITILKTPSAVGMLSVQWGVGGEWPLQWLCEHTSLLGRRMQSSSLPSFQASKQWEKSLSKAGKTPWHLSLKGSESCSLWKFSTRGNEGGAY